MAAGSVRSNVYTVLALIALAALITTVTVLWIQSNKLFGGEIPNAPYKVVKPEEITQAGSIEIHLA
jgi:hypothetical protein